MHDDSEFDAFEKDWERRPMIARDDWLIMEAEIRADPCSEEDALQKLYEA